MASDGIQAIELELELELKLELNMLLELIALEELTLLTLDDELDIALDELAEPPVPSASHIVVV